MTPVMAQGPQRNSDLRFAHELNGLFRRFRQYEAETDWVGLVMEGVGAYARQGALFVVENDTLRLRGAVNLEVPGTLQIPVANAAAFQAVVQTKEAVTALRSTSEVGSELSSAGELAHLFPILSGTRVAAVLLAAAGEDANVDLLELVCGMAACALERRQNSSSFTQVATKPGPQQAPVAAAERRLPAWAGMSLERWTLHSQAARFARVSVAEMELAKASACRAARQKGNLYVLLGKEIDKARETYRKQFMTIPSMVDYFHKELIANMLAGDATKLGADYPGELA